MSQAKFIILRTLYNPETFALKPYQGPQVDHLRVEGELLYSFVGLASTVEEARSRIAGMGNGELHG